MVLILNDKFAKVIFMLRWNWILICAGMLVWASVVSAEPNTSPSPTDEDVALIQESDVPSRSIKRGRGGERRGRDRMMGREGGGLGEGRHRGRQPKELSADQQAELFAILKEVNPELIKKIKTWQDVNPQRSARMLARMYGRMQGLMQLKNRDKEMYELKVKDFRLDAKSRLLVKQCRDDPSDQNLALLRGILASHFDVRQAIRGYELEKFKKKIEMLEIQFKEKANNREKLIEQKLNEVAKSQEKSRK